MKAYWDSSALISAVEEPELRARLASQKGFSRRHALAEVFSSLTGKAHLRLAPSEAARLLIDLADELEFVELTTEEIIKAATEAESLGVRGGRIHDLLHAVAARKSGAKILLTLDQNDFERLVPGLSIEQV
jgi:predicted nucleic acid-binding protein